MDVVPASLGKTMSVQFSGTLSRVRQKVIEHDTQYPALAVDVGTGGYAQPCTYVDTCGARGLGSGIFFYCFLTQCLRQSLRTWSSVIETASLTPASLVGQRNLGICWLLPPQALGYRYVLPCPSPSFFFFLFKFGFCIPGPYSCPESTLPTFKKGLNFMPQNL